MTDPAVAPTAVERLAGKNSFQSKWKGFRSKIKPSRTQVFGLIATVGLAVAAMLAKPSYRMFRQWRIEQNTRNASAALATGNYTKAKQLAMAVLQLEHGRRDMLVVLQQAMEGLQDSSAGIIAAQLLALPQATEEDRVLGFKMICAELPLAMVFANWQNLVPEKANSPAYLTPLITRLVDQGLIEEAASLLPQSMEADKAWELRVQIARILLALEADTLKEREYKDRGQFEIAELMEAGGETALPAFRLLAEVPMEEFRSGYFQDLEEWIQKQPEATIEDQLLALKQRRQRFPFQESQIAQEAIARYAGIDAAAVGRWLISIGMAEQALTVLPEQEAAVDIDLFRVRAEALIALQRGKAAREWLATAPTGFPMLELHALRVICADTPGDTTKRGKEWSYALLEASSSRETYKLLELQRRMLDAGLEELAREALVEALRIGRGPLPLWSQVRELLPWLYARQEGRAMLDICKVMATLEPGNAEVTVLLLDLSCIFEQIRPAPLLALLDQLKKEHPEIEQMPAFREARASALLADEQPEAALAALGEEIVDASSASGRAFAISSLAKAMLGDQALSNKLLSRVDWKTMLREERVFFVHLLARLTAPDTSEPIGNRFDPKVLPPSDDPFEAPPKPTELPGLGDRFDPKPLPPGGDVLEDGSAVNPLLPIPGSIQNAFEPKPIPPLPHGDTPEGQ